MTSATITLDRKKSAPPPVSAPPKERFGRELLAVALVFSVSCWMFFTALGGFPLFNPDEAFYAEAARGMLATGDFITTTANYAIRYTKPPLQMWMTVMAYQLFGSDEFAARFFSATCGALLVTGTYWLVNRNVGMRAALISAMVLITAPLFMVTGRLGIPDMPLSLTMTGGLFLFFGAFRWKRQALIWPAYVLLSMAVMLKGPVGVVLPVLVLAVYHLLRRNLLEALSFYKPHLGALLAAAIVLPWFIVETIVTNGEYFTCFIVMENFQRFVTVVSAHKGAWWYHIAAVSGGLVPWTIFLPQALFRALKPDTTYRNPGENRILDFYRILDGRQDLALFAACVAIVTISFFSASVSKLLSYCVPAFPALAVMIALELDSLLNQSRSKRFLAPILILATVVGVGMFVAPYIVSHLKRIPAGVSEVISGYMALQFIAFSVASLLAWRKPAIAICVFSLSTLVGGAIYGYQAAGLVAKNQEAGMQSLARFAGASGEPMYVYKARIPSATFYARRAFELSPAQEMPIAGTNRYTGVAGQSQPPDLRNFGKMKPAKNPVATYDKVSPEMAQSQIESKPRAYVICKTKDAAPLLNLQGYKKIAEEETYTLIHWVKPRN